jgi:hypothetical protein
MAKRRAMSYKNKGSKSRITFSIWFMTALCGIACLFFVILMLHELSFMNNSITTQGSILDEGTTGGRNSTAYVVVQFWDAQGTSWTETVYESDGGFSSHFHDPVGQTIPLRYTPNDPGSIEIDGMSAGRIQLYLGESAWTGVVSLALGIWGVLRMARKPRSKQASAATSST